MNPLFFNSQFVDDPARVDVELFYCRFAISFNLQHFAVILQICKSCEDKTKNKKVEEIAIK